ncbi:uncharacterized protein LTR77_001736 [Saxophila tyrrhenica]|uniref:Uncharacterized protein n=1 Tax=Saxophila tyrrhenica TaxID=1690608 RepID=A0AAV9PPI1_9PEZI|nr:hypothetical protein LTR77_001736 [Saxophila tyrrhenica]
MKWEIPRLKIGAHRKDDDGGDSPPVTPKSVVPPLSPRVDYELRTACALVLQNFKPSDYVYHERFGDDGDEEPQLDYKTQLNYAAFMQALEDDDDDAGAPLDPVYTLAHPERKRADSNGKQAESRPPQVEQKPKAPRKYSGGLWERVRSEQDEEEEEQVPPEPIRPAPALPPAKARSASHTRSKSQPLQFGNTRMKEDALRRPGSVPRSSSMMTTGSASDATDYGWKGSTAPTSAVDTPAHLSKRTSSHWLSGPKDGVDAKANVLDNDWMRRELEKHKHAQEEAKALQHARNESDVLELAVADSVAEPAWPLVKDAQPVVIEKAPAPIRIPARKPVPKSDTDMSGPVSLHQRSNSRPSAEMRRSTSRKRHTPRSESRTELEMLRPESRQGKDSLDTFATAPTNPVNPQEVYPERRPRAPFSTANHSEVPSRSRSITRQIREFIRPSSRQSSRKPSRQPSFDISRPESRSRSIDSVRSAVSALSSNDYTSSKWKSWRPFQRRDSTTNVDTNNEDDGKGQGTPDGSAKSKKKPPINLNRELPPLPSLDQWKDEEPEPPVPTKPTNFVDQTNTSNDAVQHYATQPQLVQHTLSDGPSTFAKPLDSAVTITPTQPTAHPKRTSSLRAMLDPSRFPHPPQSTKPDPVLRSIPTSPGNIQDANTNMSEDLHTPLVSPSSVRRTSTQPMGTERSGSSRSRNYFSSGGLSRTMSSLTRPSKGSSPGVGVGGSKSVSMDQARSGVEQQGRVRDGEAGAESMGTEKEKGKKRWWRSASGKG